MPVCRFKNVSEVTCSCKIISLFPQLKVAVIIACWIATRQSLEHDCTSVYIVSSSVCVSVHITQLIAGRTDECQKPFTSELLWSFFFVFRILLYSYAMLNPTNWIIKADSVIIVMKLNGNYSMQQNYI